MGERHRSDDETELIASINITPLVDIILVLLLLTMVTATVLSPESIPLNLGTPGPSAPDDVRPMIILLSADGDIRIDGVPVPKDELPQTLRRYRQRHGPNVRAVFEADGLTSHRDVVRAIDQVRAADIGRFQIRMPADR